MQIHINCIGKYRNIFKLAVSYFKSMNWVYQKMVFDFKFK